MPSSAAVDLTFLDSVTPEQASALLIDVERAREKSLQTHSLAEFVKGGWSVLEPGRELIWNWHLDTLCGYLEAVDKREIRRLIINIPPGTMKSLIVSV